MKVEAEVKELKPLIQDEIQIQLKNAKSHEFDDEKNKRICPRDID